MLWGYQYAMAGYEGIGGYRVCCGGISMLWLGMRVLKGIEGYRVCCGGIEYAVDGYEGMGPVAGLSMNAAN